jgi:hypothetical protein
MAWSGDMREERNGKPFSVGRLEEEARERVSLLVVELRAARNGLQTRFDRAPVLFIPNRKRFRL